MDIQIHEIQSQVRVTDSQALLDPAVLREIVRACVRAMKDEHERERRAASDRTLSAGIASEER